MSQLSRVQFTDVALTDENLLHLASTSPLLVKLKVAHCSLTRVSTNSMAAFGSLERLELTRSKTVWRYLADTASAPRFAELVLHDGEVEALTVPWTTITTLDLMLERGSLTYGVTLLDAAALNRLSGLANLLLYQKVAWTHDVSPTLAALTHLKTEQGNVSESVAHGAFAHLTHVDLLSVTHGIMFETLPMTVRSIKATVLHPRLIECLPRIPDLQLVDAKYVGASSSWPLVHTTPRPAPLNVLHLEYYEGSALWPALLSMGWFRNRPAKALQIDVMSVGGNVNTSFLLFSTVCWVRGNDVNIALVEGNEDDVEDDDDHEPFRINIIFMPGVDDSARPMLTAALVEFTMLVDERMSESVRSVGAAADRADDIAVDVDELALESDEENEEESDADKDMQDEDGKEE